MRTNHAAGLGARLLAVLVLGAACCALPAAAQSLANAQVAGSFDGVVPSAMTLPDNPYGEEVHARFKCTGSPTCVGTISVHSRDLNCSNYLDYTTTLQLTGFDLSKAGSFAASALLVNANEFHDVNPDGTCTFKYFSGDVNQTFNVTFDGISGGTVQLGSTPVKGTFHVVSTSPPIFPMSVSALVTSTATANATFQYRPQDVGTTGSVYVFALAPSALVKSAAAESKADASLPCVLAQLNSSGQLVAVSAASLQAYVTGVLSAGNQAVTILNGVPTANIAGATFYLGYGTSGASMYGSGVNRAALSVPGTNACTGDAPQTGWWWNPAEGGRGFSLEARGTSLFFASYLYDATGQATWLAAAGPSTLEGAAFQGGLIAFANGQTMTGAYKAPAAQPSPGNLTLTFQDATHGILSWPGGNMAIQRYEQVGSGLSLAPVANQPESGWWWNENESGRGYFIEWQGANAFLATYLYTPAGSPVWYAAQASTPDISRFAGALTAYTGGQTLTGTYHPPSSSNSVGNVGIFFTGPDTATLTWPGGTQVPIKRFRF